MQGKSLITLRVVEQGGSALLIPSFCLHDPSPRERILQSPLPWQQWLEVLPGTRCMELPKSVLKYEQLHIPSHALQFGFIRNKAFFLIPFYLNLSDCVLIHYVKWHNDLLTFPVLSSGQCSPLLASCLPGMHLFFFLTKRNPSGISSLKNWIAVIEPYINQKTASSIRLPYQQYHL